MADTLLAKRKFLITTPDSRLQKKLAGWIESHVDRTTCIFADDGLQAMQKIENDPPHVLVIQTDLPKMSGQEVVRRVFEKGETAMAVIFLSHVPESEEMVEFVALGQLQFLSPDKAEEKIANCLARALNWLSRGDQVDFSLKFLTAGEYLMRKGDQAESVYILKRGSMKAFVHETANEKNQAISHDVMVGEIAEKEFVGEMAYISGDVRSADVIAETDCELIEIPILHLDRLLFQKPAWAMALMKTLSKRMKAVNERLAHDG